MVILKRNFATRGIVVEGAQDEADEHVTIDLTVGTQYQIAGRAEWHQLSDNAPVALSGMAVRHKWSWSCNTKSVVGG